MADEQFISEAIEPEAGSFEAGAMARGEPGLPRRFVWRGEGYAVGDVLEQWVTSVPERGGGEVYLRRHWWRVRTECGRVMKLYCERQPKPGKTARRRWYLYTLEA